MPKFKTNTNPALSDKYVEDQYKTVTGSDLDLALHISEDNYASYEAARNAFFTFEVEDLNGLTRASINDPTKAEDPDGGTIGQNAEEALKLNVTSASVPHFEVEDLTYTRGNEKVHFAGVPSFSDGQIVVDDVVGLRTKEILMAWQALTYNVYTRKGGRMQDYKRKATLSEYTQDYVLIRQWRLYGCWPSSISEDSFNKESDGKRQITATIKYDRAVPLDISDEFTDRTSVQG